MSLEDDITGSREGYIFFSVNWYCSWQIVEAYALLFGATNSFVPSKLLLPQRQTQYKRSQLCSDLRPITTQNFRVHETVWNISYLPTDGSNLWTQNGMKEWRTEAFINQKKYVYIERKRRKSDTHSQNFFHLWDFLSENLVSCSRTFENREFFFLILERNIQYSVIWNKYCPE